jgi:tRNA(Ile)-lysidine synthase
MERRVGRRAWPALLHRIVKTIRSRELFDRGQHLLVAVSGGPDSIALLSLLHHLSSSWSLTLTAVHFNYGLRGAESDGDQEFVTATCHELGIPLIIRALTVQTRQRRTSLQAEARELRYRAMSEIAEACGVDRIAVGHTADDQAETVLLWMLRGTGLSGLSGMPAMREGKIIRPLYDTRRQEILAYLNERQQPFRQDSSNSKPLYLRNRVRQELIPLLQRLAPSSLAGLCRLADLCREDDALLDQQVGQLCASQVREGQNGDWAIDRSFLLQLPLAAQRRVVRNLLRRGDRLRRSPSVRTIDLVLQVVMKGTASSNLAAKSICVVIEQDVVRFVPSGPKIFVRDRLQPTASMVLAVPSQVIWTATGHIIQAEELKQKPVGAKIHEKHSIVVDADLLSGPLLVRPWQQGDRFHPLGMKGRSKKLQDFFTDLKVPIAQRTLIPVVAAPEGIVWIVGYRQDERWRLKPTTTRCLVLTAHEAPNGKGL